LGACGERKEDMSQKGKLCHGGGDYGSNKKVKGPWHFLCLLEGGGEGKKVSGKKRER